MRRILLVLTAVLFLTAGVAGGIYFQSALKNSSAKNAKPPEGDEHAATPAPPGAHDSHATVSPTEPEAGAMPMGSDDVVADQNGIQLEGEEPPAVSDHAESDAVAPLVETEVPAPDSKPGATSGSAHGNPGPAPFLRTPAPSPQSATTLPSRSSRPGTASDDLRTDAEKHFRSGNLRQARDDFQRLISRNPGNLDQELFLKLALCEETLGNLRESQANFRKVLESASHPVIRNAALQGQARLWTRTGRSDLATSSLYRVLLEGMPPNDVSPLYHHLGTLVAARVQPIFSSTEVIDPLLNDTLLLRPESRVHPVEIWDAIATSFNAAPQHFPVLRHDVVIERRSTGAINGIVVSIQIERSSVFDILRKVLQTTGLQLQVDPEALTQLQSHTLQPQCREIPLGLVLDALLDPLDIIWLQTDRSIQVIPAVQTKVDALSKFRHAVAIRILQHAIEAIPRHPLAVASQVELARMQFEEGARDEAIRVLENAIASSPRSEFLPIAWFNLGKLLLRQSRPADATLAFYHAADMMNGENLETGGYLYVGRILLESDDPRSAITPLTRALSLATGSRYEAVAALQLSSAYLMLKHFQRANSVLMEHLKVLDQPIVRDQAAFLSMLIHFLKSTDAEERFRKGTNLIGTLTNLNSSSLFGGHWQLLVGLAYRETGMTQNAIQILTRCLEESYSFPLQNRMRGMLLQDAPEMISRLTNSSPGVLGQNAPTSLQVEALLLDAESKQYQGQYDEAIRVCRELLRRSNVADAHRRAALKLMGQAYQSQGRYEESVLCFTGIIPKEVPPEPAPSASMPRGVLR